MRRFSMKTRFIVGSLKLAILAAFSSSMDRSSLGASMHNIGIRNDSMNNSVKDIFRYYYIVGMNEIIITTFSTTKTTNTS